MSKSFEKIPFNQMKDVNQSNLFPTLVSLNKKMQDFDCKSGKVGGRFS